MMRLRGFMNGLRAAQQGIALLEFALTLPLFLGFLLAGIECFNYVLANNRVQRMATMTADLVAQSGVGSIGVTEGQIYDLFSAVDLTAQPFDLRGHGRVAMTAIKGVDSNNDGTVENSILWQRFDGNYVVAPVVGCAQTVTNATLPNARTVLLGETLYHVQVTYQYQPIFTSVPFQWLSLPTDFTRTAMFAARNKDFQSPTPDVRFPPKNKCNTVSGL